MDELTLLSRLRENPPPAGDDVLPRARGQLLERAAGRKPAARTQPRRRHRLAADLGAVAGAAGLLLAAPIGLDILAPDGRSLGATAEAASLLNRAAINARDPVIGPAQYLKVTSRGVHINITELADRRRVHYYTSDLIEVWIPTDPSRPWVLRRTTEPHPFPSAAEERALRLKAPSAPGASSCDEPRTAPSTGRSREPGRRRPASSWPGCRTIPTGYCGASTATQRVKVPPSMMRRWCTSPTCSAPGSSRPTCGPPCSERRSAFREWGWSRAGPT
jgi:hypothetical protein